jgi:hypothetical protein
MGLAGQFSRISAKTHESFVGVHTVSGIYAAIGISAYASTVVSVSTVAGIHAVTVWILLFTSATFILSLLLSTHYCHCSSSKFLLKLLSRVVLASLLHVAGFFTVADTDSSDLDAC